MPYKDPEKRRLYNKLYLRKYRKTYKYKMPPKVKKKRRLWQKEHRRKYRLKHLDYCKKGLDRLRNRLKQAKIDIFKMYGNKCKCCGESISQFLTVDHINNDGNLERQKKKGLTYINILNEGYKPNKFQILCWNCNRGKFSNKGICPHEFYKK